jgi:thioredoxin 1
MEGKLMVAKVDVEQNQELAFGLVSIPTLRLYVNGEVVKEIIGAHPKPYLLKELAEWL